MTGYMKEMRKLVGQRPIFQCGASVIIFDEEDRVLMLQRTDNNQWCFPGGSLELGECAEDAAIRETKEETGLSISELELFHAFSGEELYYKYPNGDEVYNVDIVFISKKYKGNLIESEESSALCFFSIRDLPKDISPPVIPVVNRLKNHYIK